MPFVMLNDLRIHYELYGDAGEPLVFIHGYSGDTVDWVHQIERFSEGYRLLVFDNRGHGESEACADREAYSVEHMVEDAVQLIEKIGFEQYHLVGHSIGGAIAQEIALRSPERLLSLTLQDTTHWFGDHEEPGGTPPYTPPEDAKNAAQRVARMSKDAVAGAWKGLMEWAGSTDRVHEIQVPTLIIHGDRDASRIIEGSRRLSELIPHAHYVVIKGAGHSPQRECREEFNSALERFLSGARARTAV
jgi:3-oxoadipate enol-lactonase